MLVDYIKEKNVESELHLPRGQWNKISRTICLAQNENLRNFLKSLKYAIAEKIKSGQFAQTVIQVYLGLDFISKEDIKQKILEYLSNDENLDEAFDKWKIRSPGFKI